MVTQSSSLSPPILSTHTQCRPMQSLWFGPNWYPRPSGQAHVWPPGAVLSKHRWLQPPLLLAHGLMAATCQIKYRFMSRLHIYCKWLAHTLYTHDSHTYNLTFKSTRLLWENSISNLLSQCITLGSLTCWLPIHWDNTDTHGIKYKATHHHTDLSRMADWSC